MKIVCEATWGEDFPYDLVPCDQPATHEVAWDGIDKWFPVCEKHAKRSQEEYGCEVRPLEIP